MALPVGRGAIGFQTANPLPTEPITIPRLCLSGKAPPRGKGPSIKYIGIFGLFEPLFPSHRQKWDFILRGPNFGLFLTKMHPSKQLCA